VYKGKVYTPPPPTVGSQATKSISEIWIQIVASIKATMLLRLTVVWFLIESEYLSYTNHHNVGKLYEDLQKHYMRKVSIFY
jgi:hypothetical protein